MASIADLLGVQWNGAEPSYGGYTMSPHAAKQASEKGFAHEDVLTAAHDPQIRSDNGRYPGQKRHVRGHIVAVVDPAAKRVVTTYVNVERTALRSDQTDRDAQRYGRSLGRGK